MVHAGSKKQMVMRKEKVERHTGGNGMMMTITLPLFSVVPLYAPALPILSRGSSISMLLAHPDDMTPLYCSPPRRDAGPNDRQEGHRGGHSPLGSPCPA